MIEFPSQFLKEIEILRDKRVININQHNESDSLEPLIQSIEKFDLNESKKFIFLYKHETLTNELYLDDIYHIIDSYNLDAYISTSTSSHFNRSVHPLTNLLMWKGVKTRNDISWDYENSDYIFNPDIFYHGKVLRNNHKLYNGILSVRKQNDIRDYLFSKNIKINDGIVRYAKWVNDPDDETDFHRDIVNNFPTMGSLVSEYDKSYFSFIVESEHGNGINLTTNFTEKTVMAFLTGTMPIVLGGSNYVKELKEMGFYVWNDEFGFGNGDWYSTHSKYKVDKFFNCIETVNKYSLNQTQLYWENNIDKIQKNYDIISEILFGKITDKIFV